MLWYPFSCQSEGGPIANGVALRPGKIAQGASAQGLRRVEVTHVQIGIGQARDNAFIANAAL